MGSFRIKLNDARTVTGKVPVSFFGMTCADGSVKSYACYDMTFYGATFYKDGKPVAEYIPVVKGGVAGIYDNVDFLCSDELCGGAISSETENYIRYLTRRHGGEWRIYTANVNPHPNEKVCFVLPPEIPANAKVEVMYENRSLQSKVGTLGPDKTKVNYFLDSYDGFARHIYRIVK